MKSSGRATLPGEAANFSGWLDEGILVEQVIFLGTYLNRLDAKGRVSIPAPFRTLLRTLQEDGSFKNGRVIIRPSHQYECIEFWPEAVFYQVAAETGHGDIFSREPDDRAVVLYADSRFLETDKEGRVAPGADLLAYAGIEDEAVFMGIGRIFLLWNKDKADLCRQKARENVAGGGGFFGERDFIEESGSSLMRAKQGRHIPVLLQEAVEGLALKPGGLYWDATFGGGGYSQKILEDVAATKVIATDRDPDALLRGEALKALYPERFTLLQGCFGDIKSLLRMQGLLPEAASGKVSDSPLFDGIVFDFGLSSFQTDTPERGFSFMADGPLDMRMSAEGLSAADVVNNFAVEEIEAILRNFGEEPFARRIAKAIVRRRQEKLFTGTADLADIIRQVVPLKKERIDKATKSFQALRIYVNDELGEIQRGLEAAASLLKPGGRLVAVSFHSLEDRAVKQFMKEKSTGPSYSRHAAGAFLPPTVGEFILPHKKAITPTEDEIKANPRSGSARLRLAERRSDR